jgi:hypothetical protein
MTDEELLAQSARELALYRDLLEAYATLHAALGEPAASGAAVGFGEALARTEETVAALHAVSGVLAPWRLGGRRVPEAVRATWRAAAELAAEALEANAALLAAARSRQGAIAARLGVLAVGRRALAGYARAATASAA